MTGVAASRRRERASAGRSSSNPEWLWGWTGDAEGRRISPEASENVPVSQPTCSSLVAPHDRAEALADSPHQQVAHPPIGIERLLAVSPDLGGGIGRRPVFHVGRQRAG